MDYPQKFLILALIIDKILKILLLKVTNSVNEIKVKFTK